MRLYQGIALETLPITRKMEADGEWETVWRTITHQTRPSSGIENYVAELEKLFLVLHLNRLSLCCCSTFARCNDTIHNYISG